jgi:hypothetical protein
VGAVYCYCQILSAASFFEEYKYSKIALQRSMLSWRPLD